MHQQAHISSSHSDQPSDHANSQLVSHQVRDDGLAPATLSGAAATLHRELRSIVALIPAPLVREQMADPMPGRIRGAYWYGSVVFADLSGFTALSERLSALGKQGAEEISVIVNQLFADLIEEVHRFGGAPLKFGGDALTIFFDAAVVGQNHAALASAAALAMQRRMDAFAVVPTPVGQFWLRLRIGVHSGPVFAAQVGDRDHIELVLSGNTVNHVARAQAVAAPGEVVISAKTLSMLRPTLLLRAAQRSAGFYMLDALPPVALPAAFPPLIPPLPARPDRETLELLNNQLAGLRPYLMHGLPSRYIEMDAPVGEFRPVSTLFAHLASFSNILESLGDATDLAAAMLNAYYRRAQNVIHSYGGVVNKVDTSSSGDKLMALFGAPTAHEDDPARAVRCALDLALALHEANDEIVEQVGERLHQPDDQKHPGRASSFTVAHTHYTLHQSIGINTGTAFAGRVGPPERHEYTVMGPGVNLAARLMSKAEAGTVILSPSTRRAVEREIRVIALPPISLKGFAEPVQAALALQRADAAASMQPTKDDGLSQAPLVGRESELEQCLEHSYAALNGAGRVLALVGVAGIGKTRLMQELLVRLDNEAHTHKHTRRPFAIYLGDCQSYEQSTPYGAVRGLIHYLLKLDMGARTSVEQLAPHVAEHVQALTPQHARFAPVLGDLLGTPLPDTPLTAQLSPHERHDRAHDLIEALVRRRIGDDGMLLMIDDIHWADPSSLELLERLARSAESMRLLLGFCYRLDSRLSESWIELPNALRVHLRELPHVSSQVLTGALLDGTPPPELMALLDRTQGNPFFIEEMLRDLVATHTLVYSTTENTKVWRLARPITRLTLPDSIEGVLVAQLDRLAEHSHEVAQVAAVIGRRFMYRILEHIDTQHTHLDRSLQQLTDSDIILAEKREHDQSYLFRHTLMRDVAYESILYGRRRTLHQQVAECIVDLYGRESPDQVPLLARHYLLAEDWTQAFHYHWLAGCAAQQRYANDEALALFDEALGIAPQLDPRPFDREVEILERSGMIGLLIGDYDHAQSWFERALTILEGLPTATSDMVVRLYRLIADTYEHRANFDLAFDWLRRAIARTDDTSLNERARCYLLWAGLLQRQGKFHECLEWIKRGLNLAESIKSTADQAKAYKLLSGTCCSLGDFDQAIEATQRCLEFYIEVGNLQEQGGANINLGNLLYDLGRWKEARAAYEAAVALTTEIGNTYEQALAANNLGEVLRSQGDAEGASEHYRHALVGWQHSPFHSAIVAMNLGATCIQQGDFIRAREYLDQSAALFAQVRIASFLPELLRYRAKLELALGNSSNAQRICEESIQLAHSQDTSLEEARSQRLLGCILLHTGQIAEAGMALHTSLRLIQTLNISFDVARTSIWLAEVYLYKGDHANGQALLQEALACFHELGAQYDIAETQQIAVRHQLVLALS